MKFTKGFCSCCLEYKTDLHETVCGECTESMREVEEFAYNYQQMLEAKQER